jgi:hypothetical protein
MALHPGYTKQELRAIIRVVLNHKTSKLKSSHIVNFTVPYLGRIKSHGNKKVKRYRKYLVKDRRKKKALYTKSLFTKEKLLWG